MRIWCHNANEPVEQICENCFFATETDVDGLMYCHNDERTKDCDMSCKQFEKR